MSNTKEKEEEENQKDPIETGKKKNGWKTFGKIILGIIPFVLLFLGGGKKNNNS